MAAAPSINLTPAGFAPPQILHPRRFCTPPPQYLHPYPRRICTLPRPDDVSEQVWQDWVAHRKGKGASVSLTVLSEARKESDKAGLPLERFLAIWCARGSQGLQADWLKPHERGSPQPSGETAYQRNMRERMEGFAPGIAARPPGQQRPLTVIQEVQDVPAIASR
jgi:hypothetical protein